MVPLGGVTPAVTATVQSTYLTGLPPSEHGVVGNGWLFRDTMEVRLWRQSNRLVQAPKVWEARARASPARTCSGGSPCTRRWIHGHAAADVPGRRPQAARLCTKPGDLRDALQAELGQFPLFKFWGPATSIDSTRWIAEAAKRVDGGSTRR